MGLSSARWKARQAKDIFVKQAKEQALRSRASFKILDVHRQYQLFSSGMRVLELGAAPGGWTQVVRPLLGSHGQLLAVDRVAMMPLPGVTFIQGDLQLASTQMSIQERLAGEAVDYVISDMAPSLSGIRIRDQALSLELNRLCHHLAKRYLKKGGGMLVKVFQGAGLEAFKQELEESFEELNYCKPEASRSGSRECYILARKFIGNFRNFSVSLE